MTPTIFACVVGAICSCVDGREEPSCWVLLFICRELHFTESMLVGWYAEVRRRRLQVGKDDFCVDKKANDLPEWRHIFFI